MTIAILRATAPLLCCARQASLPRSAAAPRRSCLRRPSRVAAFVSAGAPAAQLLAGDAVEVVRSSALVAHASPLFQLAALDPATASTVAGGLGPLLSVGTLLFIIRIVMTWYPDIRDDAWPWSIVYVPTEPLLAPTRKLITPVGGVDVSPIVWVALLSFLNEILLGKQGLLILLASKAQ